MYDLCTVIAAYCSSVESVSFASRAVEEAEAITSVFPGEMYFDQLQETAAEVEGLEVLALAELKRREELESEPSKRPFCSRTSKRTRKVATKKCDSRPRCIDCGEIGEMTGHQTCQYPQDH